MRRAFAIAMVWVGLIGFVWASTQTRFGLPAASDSFLADLQTFLRDELPNALAPASADYVVSGGTAPTSTSLTHTIGALVARVNGYHVEQAATVTTYTATRRTYVYVTDDDTGTPTVTGGSGCTFKDRIGSGGTPSGPHIIRVECATSSGAPTLSNVNATPLFYADTDATQITAVTDFRNRIFGQNETISSNLTTDAKTFWVVLPNVEVTIASGVTVTHNGGLSAPTQRWIVLSGTGRINFANPATIIRPEWWGAKIGSDDSIPIQAALDAAPVGGIVRFAGVYNISTDLLPKSDTTLEGEDRWNTVLNVSSPATRPIWIRGADRVTVRNLKIDGLDATNAKQCVAIVADTGGVGSDDILVERVWTVRCGQYGIVVGDKNSVAPFGGKMRRIVIRDNIVDMTGVILTSAIGIEFFPKASTPQPADPGPIISGNVVIGTGSSIADGIKCSNSVHPIIENNVVYMSGASTEEGGINTVASFGAVVSKNFVFGAKNGITVSGGSGNIPNGVSAENTVVSHNVVKKYTNGIFSSEGVVGLKILHNVLDYGGEPSSSFSAINLVAHTADGRDYADLAIIGNEIKGPGIVLTDAGGFDSVNAIVMQNIVDSSGTTAGTSGILIRGDFAKLSHNTVKQSTSQGIQITGDKALISFNHVIDGNTTNSASQSGINVVGDGAVILGNRVENTGVGHLKFGLTLNGADDAVMRDNVFVSMEDREINLIGTITSARPRTQGTLVSNTLATAPADTLENTLKTVTLPAGFTTAFGGVRVRSAGTASGAGGTKTVRLYFGGAVVATLTIGTGSVDWLIDAEIWQANGVGAQQAFVRAYAGTTLVVLDQLSLAVATTTAVEVKITGQKASGGDGLTAANFVVDVIH